MKKLVLPLFALVLCMSWVTQINAATTQVDALIEKLVEKGILTRSESIKLKGEIAADEKLHREEGLKMSLPEWVQKMKLKGDFRLRYQYERKQSDPDARSRGRIRYRLGVETDVVKSVKVGAGLASGADDPRSTNQTFTDTFETSDIRLDYAYGEWNAINSAQNKLNLIGGIHPRSNYLWTPTDMIWDTDITTHGGAASYEHKFSDILAAYFNTGVWVIDEVSSTTTDRPDPFLHYSQAGVKWQNGRVKSNVAAIYYAYNALKGTCPDWSSASNTGITTSSSGSCSAGSLKYDYDAVGGSAEIAFMKPFDLPVEEVAVFADIISNIDGLDEDDSNGLDDSYGWAAGLKFGDPRVNGKNQWQAKYLFVNLQKDAVPDFLPDSDRYGGRTDVRSHEGIFEYGLTKNVIVGLDYYQSRRIRAAANVEHLLQADLNLKF